MSRESTSAPLDPFLGCGGKEKQHKHEALATCKLWVTAFYLWPRNFIFPRPPACEVLKFHPPLWKCSLNLWTTREAPWKLMSLASIQDTEAGWVVSLLGGQSLRPVAVPYTHLLEHVYHFQSFDLPPKHWIYWLPPSFFLCLGQAFSHHICVGMWRAKFQLLQLEVGLQKDLSK